jgi:uncharacterized protein
MAEVFADTGGWAAAFVPSESWNVLATRLIRRWRADGTLVVTTNYVLAELAALLTRPLRVSRRQQVGIIDNIKMAKWVEVLHVDPVIDQHAWDLYRNRLDKEWSLVDCSSFVVMQQRGILEALTPDHHFEQARFVRLLK